MWVVSVGHGQKGISIVLVYVGNIGGTRSERNKYRVSCMWVVSVGHGQKGKKCRVSLCG